MGIHEDVLIRPVSEQPFPFRMAESIMDDDGNLADLTDGNDGSSVEVTDNRHITEDPRLIQEFSKL